MLFALVDCINFYASCERVFNARLARTPIVVLSNNDGCIIARSEEVKALGIPMGAPFFTYRRWLEHFGVHVASANYELYGDLSHRVVLTLHTFSDTIEVYSIDESFLHLPGLQPAALHEIGMAIHQRVLRWTGLPVRVGIAPTKTLAKVASDVAKHRPEPVAVIDPTTAEQVLSRLAVDDVWGIGPRWAARLRRHRIYTALDLRDADDGWIRRHLNVTALRTVYELRGVCCLPLECAPTPRKSTVYSRSFGHPVTARTAMDEAVATYTSRAAAKVRRHGLAPRVLHVFLHTSKHGRGPQYSNACTLRLPQATTYTPMLIRTARAGLDRIWRPGYAYQKAGVMLLDLAPETPSQAHLFLPHNPRHAALMQAVDQINRQMGQDTIRFARAGTASSGRNAEQPAWALRCGHRSPRYTTRWDELPRAIV